MATYYSSNLSKIEKLLKELTEQNSRERKVLQRYNQLAGLIRDGEMINKDKESRARQWVAEREQKEKDDRAKRKWWERNWAQAIFLLGAIAGIIGLLSLFK